LQQFIKQTKIIQTGKMMTIIQTGNRNATALSNICKDTGVFIHRTTRNRWEKSIVMETSRRNHGN